MAIIFTSVMEWQLFRKQSLFNNKSLGFVPTMGNLHHGHASLLGRARLENDFVVLSIFVNPTQFDNADDLQRYPKTIDADIAIAEQHGVDFILLPNYSDLYPDNYRYQVNENDFSHAMEGQIRPGHFTGMLTVVMKLLLLLAPQRAYFGEKDFQQLQLVHDMVKAFFLHIEIIGCSTVRDQFGLALSSRNSRLTQEQYQVALNFPQILHKTISVDEVIDELSKVGFIVEYVVERDNRRFGAVKVGDVRLIDNVVITWDDGDIK